MLSFLHYLMHIQRFEFHLFKNVKLFEKKMYMAARPKQNKIKQLQQFKIIFLLHVHFDWSILKFKFHHPC